MTLPLKRGSGGEEVRDLHRRLTAAGFAPGDVTGRYTAATDAAVEAFQRDRGLEATGVCDQSTWDLLVEAGYRLGDRLLYLQAPMLRGDDVQELQLRLSSLGFDAGRVDGIFGPQTERALAEVQRNAGLPTDGIAGRATIGELCRLGAMADRGDPVAVVRERESLRRAPRDLGNRRIVVGDLGGSDALATAVSRLLRHAGGEVMTLHEPDGSLQAASANRFEAELYVGLSVNTSSSAAYFATTGFESAGGRRLAELCAERLTPVLGRIDRTTAATCQVLGTRVPVLRETRMPAVLCRVGPPDVAVGGAADVARAVSEAIRAWVTAPVDDDA
jgi:N-acetylmuramoyl-L-alanine amidase